MQKVRAEGRKAKAETHERAPPLRGSRRHRRESERAGAADLRRRRAAVRGARPPGGRLAGQSRARAAPRRSHLLQSQPAARGHERVRGVVPLLLVRAAEAGHARRPHAVGGAGPRPAARPRRRAAHRSPHRQRAAPGPAVQLLHRSAERHEARPPRHSPQVLHRGGDCVLRRPLRQDRSRRCSRSCARPGSTRCPAAAPRFSRRACGGRSAHDKCDGPIATSPFTATAHGLGMRTNVTMLYGHIETMDERVDHLLQLRALQDETGGFQAFIPLAFHPDNNQMRKLPPPSASRHAARARRGAAAARQRRPHQGLLDLVRRRGGADGAVVRRRRSRRHRAGRDHLPHGRVEDADGAVDRATSSGSSATRGARRSSATRSTTWSVCLSWRRPDVL